MTGIFKRLKRKELGFEGRVSWFRGHGISWVVRGRLEAWLRNFVGWSASEKPALHPCWCCGYGAK